MIDWERRRFAIEYALGQGKTPAEIAARYQVGFPQLRKHLEKWGLQQVDESPTIRPADGEPAMTTRRKNEARDALILERVEAGERYEAIATAFGVSRGTISDVVDRYGSKAVKRASKDTTKANIRLANSIRAKQQHREGRAAGKPMTFGRVTSFEPKPPTPVSHTVFEQRSNGQWGSSEDQKLAPRMPAMESAQGVDLFSRTGCAWPFETVGSDKPPFVYCNRPRALVKSAGGSEELVPYCSNHWEKRRASKYTRIISEG